MNFRDDDGSACRSPDDVFAVVGNQTRFEILQALWTAYDPHGRDNAVPFSELYRRVEYSDSGNFSYHLEKLTDHFVRRTEDGYELTGSGLEIVRSVLSGTVSERPDVNSVEIDARCPLCESPVEVDYENQRTVARCTDCSGLFGAGRSEGVDECLFHLPFPPAGWENRTPEEVFHTTVSLNFQRIRSFLDGVCPYCGGVVDESVHVCDEHEPDDHGHCPHCKRHHRVEVRETCRHCKASEWGPLTIAILAHPAVTAFYHDHGIEYRFASWETFHRAQTVDEELLETDPLRVRVTVPCGDDRLELTVDESLAVIDAVETTSQ